MSDVVLGMNREEYDRVARLNWSKLRLMGKSPAHYMHGGHRDSKAKKLGSASHSAILEPEVFAGLKVFCGDKVKAAGAWKAFKAEHPPESIISEAERDEALRIRDAVFNNSDAAALLTMGHAEVTCLWELAGVGFSFECKSRIDFDSPQAVVELKTARDASPREFGKQAAQLCYPGQLAWYREGLHRATGTRKPVVLIAVETEAPYPVTVFDVEERELAYGWDRCCEYLEKVEACQRSGMWPGYASSRVPLELPKWAMETFEEDVEAA